MSSQVREITPFEEPEFVLLCAELGVTLTDVDLQAQVDATKAALAAMQARPVPVWGLDGLVDGFEPTPVCENTL